MNQKCFKHQTNTNQELLGLRNKKEEADKEVGWPDPNPGATQLDLPTGICPHAPLHSSYPPSPSRYAQMLRQPHECHFKLHTGASLMDSRTTQAGGMYGKQQQNIFAGTKISVNNLKRIFGRKFFQRFQIGSSTLWIVDVAKSQLGIAPWWWFCPGTKAFKRTQGENASCFADTSFLKGHCLLMRWVNKGFSGGLGGLNKFKAFSGGHSTIQPLWPCHQSNQGTKKAVKMTPRCSRPRWHLACLARLVGHRVRRRA